MDLSNPASVNVTVAYDVPAVVAPQNPLVESTVYYSLDGGVTPVKASVIPVVNPQGGDHVSHVVTIPAPAGTSTTFEVWATETDTVGQEGPHSLEVKMVVNRVLPSAPTNFTVA